MGINKLVEAALIVVMMAATVGEIPRLIQAVRVAHLHVLKESQSSRWGQAFLLPMAK
jgi:hypothetical protein